jgi:ferredoxin
MPYIVTSDCIQCGACVAGCESNAITDGDTQSNIDVTICIECGTCKLNCPSDAIIFVEEGETVKQLP